MIKSKVLWIARDRDGWFKFHNQKMIAISGNHYYGTKENPIVIIKEKISCGKALGLPMIRKGTQRQIRIEIVT